MSESTQKKFDWRGLLTLPAAVGWRDHVIGAALFFVYVVWLVATARSLGFPRDESFYFQAGTSYARWFDLLFTHPKDAFERSAVDGAWAMNHEHPSLMKSLFGLSWLLLHEKWKLVSDATTAFRLPGMAMGGLSLWVTYLFGARIFSRQAGLIAAALLALMPHVFFHSHLACFDIPIMTMWLVATYVYFRSIQEGGWGWALAAGIAYGLTLETKHNAWILPGVFVPHALLVVGQAFRRAGGMRLPASAKAEALRAFPLSLLSMATIGPLVFYSLWPWLWADTAARLQEYLNFHLNHEYYNIEYLGKNYFGPPSPRSYAPVMILATVPSIALLLWAIGTGDRIWALWERVRSGLRHPNASLASEDAEEAAPVATPAPAATPATPPTPAIPASSEGDLSEVDVLLFLSLAAPLAVFFLPKTPIFGGTKHWLPAYPFLALFAGHGFDLVAKGMERALAKWPDARRVTARWGLALSCLLGPLAVTVHSHPFGLSAYVPLVGGTAGGADLGLNRQFWGFTTQSVAPYLAENAPRGAGVFIHDTTGEAWARMQSEGRMRQDLRAAWSPSEAQFSLVQHELHMNEVDYQIWVVYGSPAPAYVLTHDGVPIVSVYRKK